MKAKAYSCDIDDGAADGYHDIPGCPKCSAIREADALRIDVHEWPLPETELVCASVVLELDCPQEFAAWRNMTWMILHDIGRNDANHKENASVILSQYDGLRRYYRLHNSRLTLASTTKALSQCSGWQLEFPVESADRCLVSNTLTYKLFDPQQMCWIGAQKEKPSISRACITLLPYGPYSNLQYAVDSTCHSQNEVIADQVFCSKDLSLHEFIAFGSLRADGEGMQWHSIRRELGAYNLSFNTQEVCTLITQMAWQVGSRPETVGSVSRISHSNLKDTGFYTELLDVVATRINSIKANWKSNHVMLSLLIICLRVITLCGDSDVNEMAFNLLSGMRTNVYNWIEILSYKLSLPLNTKQKIFMLQHRLLKTAILCKLTYDVDRIYVPKIFSTDKDLQIWISCSMIVRENVPGDVTTLSPDQHRMLLRDQKLTHALHVAVRNQITRTGGAGLNSAIKLAWSTFQQTTTHWNPLEIPK